MALAAEAQAVATAVLGPHSPKWMETLPAAALAIIFGMTNGLILPGPPLMIAAVLFFELVEAADAAAEMTPQRIRILAIEVEAAVLDGGRGGHQGELGEAVQPLRGLGRRAQSSGSKSLTSPPKWTLKAEVSNCSIGADAALAGAAALARKP